LVVTISDIFLAIEFFKTSSVKHKYKVFSNKSPLDKSKSLFVVVIIFSMFVLIILLKAIF